MGSLEYLQKQLQKEYYSLTTLNDKLAGKSPIYDDLIEYKNDDYHSQKLIFDKVTSNLYYPNDWKYSYRRDIQEIIPGLFLGGYISANKSKKNYLLKHGITHILCIRNEYEANWIKPQHTKEFNYLTLNIDDSPDQNIIPFFELTNQFILETIRNGGKILVHSNAGISRSSTIVIAFIMFYFNCNSKNAIKFVQNFRFCIYPNESFRRQLLEYEPILAAQLMKKGCDLSLTRKRSFSDEEFEGDQM